MQLGKALYAFFKGTGERMLWKDKRGQFLGLSLPMLIIMAVVGIFGISILGSINWHFLIIIMMMLVIGIGMIGVVFYKMKFQYIMIISLICLAITLFITITAPVIVGIMLVAFAMWKFTPQKQPAIWIGLIGVGLILVVWGTTQLATLGIFP